MKVRCTGNVYHLLTDGEQSSLVKDPVISQFNNEGGHAVIGAVADPAGAFARGKASANVRARREGKFEIFARTDENVADAVLTLIDAMPLQAKGIDFGVLLADAIAPGVEGEAKAVIAAHLAYGIPQGTEVVEGTTLDRLNESRVRKAENSNDPLRRAVAANDESIFQRGETKLDDGDLEQLVTNPQPIVFDFNDGSAGGRTELFVWTNGSSQVNKTHANSFAYAWTRWCEILIETPADRGGGTSDLPQLHTEEAPFVIWRIQDRQTEDPTR